MAAGIYNLSIEQGTSWELTLEVDIEAGTDMDLTNYTFACKIAKSFYDDNAVSMGVTIVDSSAGKFKVFLTPEQTALLDDSIEYLYDVKITSPAEVVTRLLQGRATVNPGVPS